MTKTLTDFLLPTKKPVDESQPPLHHRPVPDVQLSAKPQEIHAPAEAHVPEKKFTAMRSQITSQMEMPNLGVLDQLMRDDSISDILINGTENIFIDRAGQLIDSGLRFATHEDVWQVAEEIMRTSRHHWTDECPMIDTRLPDGSRVNLVGPPIAVDGVSISIRKFPKIQVTLDSMAADGQMTHQLAQFLKECVRLRLNIIIAGGTSSGKTTFLNALSGAISHGERVVTIEDSAELQMQGPHVVRLEAKGAYSDVEKDRRKTNMRALIKNALRMRPDRIIVGESRGAEAFDVLQAMNTGHAGSMTTLHANSPRDALARLETMVMLAMPNLPVRMVRAQIASSVNLVIQIARSAAGDRYVSHITEICGLEGEVMVMQDLVVYNDGTKRGPEEHRWNNVAPRNPLVSEAARNAEIIKPPL